MITKALTSKKEVTKFKKEYSNNIIETEVISNKLQPFHSDKYPELLEFTDFWYTNKDAFKLKMILEHYALEALNTKFGKYDFTFTGNRTYKNHVLKYDDLIIIAPSKREYVIDKSQNEHDVVKKLIKFEKEFYKLLLKIVLDNNMLDDYDQKEIEGLKTNGFLVKYGFLDEQEISNNLSM